MRKAILNGNSNSNNNNYKYKTESTASGYTYVSHACMNDAFDRMEMTTTIHIYLCKTCVTLYTDRLAKDVEEKSKKLN